MNRWLLYDTEQDAVIISEAVWDVASDSGKKPKRTKNWPKLDF